MICWIRLRLGSMCCLKECELMYYGRTDKKQPKMPVADSIIDDFIKARVYHHVESKVNDSLGKMQSVVD